MGGYFHWENGRWLRNKHWKTRIESFAHPPMVLCNNKEFEASETKHGKEK